ncbi:MAG: hypothetical protein MUF62_03690, partial [Chitinophagaceae bacterium]|nr:hypothetical protein [Chitinophagaceae bacterium]
MRTLLPLALLWASLLVVGCRQHSNVSPASTAATADSLPLPAGTKLDAYLQRFNNTRQQYRASMQQKQIRIQGRQGTRFVINTADLQTTDGSALADSIDITLMELHNQQQLLLANAPTVSNGKLLVSGGAVYIHLSSQGKTVQLKPGKTYKAAFPTLRRQNMRLFYGDTSAGTLNWVAAADSFRLPAEVPDTVIAEEQVVEDLIVSFELTGDTARMAMDTMSKSVFEKRKKTGQREQAALKAERATFEKQKARRKQRLEYSEISLQSFEWINCDDFVTSNVFYRINIPVSLSLEPLAEYRTYLVFHEINAVMSTQVYHYSGKDSTSAIFDQIPAGYTVQAVSVAVTHNQLFAAMSAPFRTGSAPPALT